MAFQQVSRIDRNFSAAEYYAGYQGNLALARTVCTRLSPAREPGNEANSAGANVTFKIMAYLGSSSVSPFLVTRSVWLVSLTDESSNRQHVT